MEPDMLGLCYVEVFVSLFREFIKMKCPLWWVWSSLPWLQVGNHINVLTGEWKATDFTVGNFVDSYLEYLVKGGILLRRPELLEMFHGEYMRGYDIYNPVY